MTTVQLSGLCEGPDDIYLGLRGLRTLAVRLERHYKSGLAVARWLGAAAGSFAHATSGAWKAIPATHRGSGISPAPAACSAWCSSRCRRRRYIAFLDTLAIVRHRRIVGRLREPRHTVRLHGGCAPRHAGQPGGPTIRFHIGLEAVEDLIADLERGFAALAAAAAAEIHVKADAACLRSRTTK